MAGCYPSIDNYIITSGNVEVNNSRVLLDPIDTVFKNSDGKGTKPRLNVGIRFKLVVETLHFDYTYTKYSMMAA